MKIFSLKTIWKWEILLLAICTVVIWIYISKIKTSTIAASQHVPPAPSTQTYQERGSAILSRYSSGPRSEESRITSSQSSSHDYTDDQRMRREYEDAFKSWLARTPHKGLVLTDSELHVLATEVFNFVKINGELKAAAAKVVNRDDGGIEVHIPARQEDALRTWAVFQEELTAQLTKARADAIDDAIGADLGISYFEGFGAAEEEYIITPDASKAGTYKLSYSIYIPKPMAGPSELISGNFVGTYGENFITRLSVLGRPQFAFLARYLPNDGN